MYLPPVWFKCNHNEHNKTPEMKRKKNHLIAPGIGRANVPARPGPPLHRRGSSAVSAVGFRTSRHVSFGWGQETWNRISSNTSFLQRVFYTKLKRRGVQVHFKSVWNSGKEPSGSLNMDSTVKRSCSRRTFQGLQALFPWTRDTTRTALTFVDAQIGETWHRHTCTASARDIKAPVQDKLKARIMVSRNKKTKSNKEYF